VNAGGPLDGITVVQIGVAMAGPFCAMMLADYGAQVVKIERVGAGDDSRAWPPFFHDAVGHYFAAANRNKQSVALDLKRPEGVEVARRLIGEADVVVDNYRISAFNERMWRDLCDVLERPGWADDPRFCDAVRRAENRDLLVGMIGELMAPHPVAYWQARLKAAGVPCSPINRIDRAVAEAQVRARDMVVQLELPGLGTRRMAGLPLKFSETPGRIARHPPRLGQHTAEVLTRLGYTGEAIEELAARGAVGLDPGWRAVTAAKAAEEHGTATR